MNLNVVIDFLLGSRALSFGDFVTKSGRKTPYFLDTGSFYTASQINTLASTYATKFKESVPLLPPADRGGPFNLYGPAYKGIPLVSAMACQMASPDVTITFNRKEVKDHGEGGSLVGYKYDAPTKVFIVEDVITAGTSVRETMDILGNIENAQVVGSIILCDRMEVGIDSDKSAVQQVEEEFGFKVFPIVTIEDIIAFLDNPSRRDKFGIHADIPNRMREYREMYGVKR